MKEIYFDNAATTFKKPRQVYNEADRAHRLFSANSGRSSHFLSLGASEKIFDCREALAEMFGAKPENVIFTFNTTYALNMAIKGTTRRGDHILLSNLEHNSVFRPIRRLKADGVIDYDIFDAYCAGFASPEHILEDIQRKIRPSTRCLVCTHTSNICSYSPPICEIGKLCRERGIIFIVDAAQGVGHTKIDMTKSNIDILCLPSHKGLYGPQGIGVMILSGSCFPETLIEGGSGTGSLMPTMPDEAPERYEAGTLPCHLICGLRAGVEFVTKYGYRYIAEKEAFLWDRLYRKLCDNKKIKIYDKFNRGSIFLFNIRGKDSSDVCSALSDKGICVRSGYHCAPLAHDALGTHADGCGGAVRVSFSVFNTSEEVDALAREILSLQ